MTDSQYQELVEFLARKFDAMDRRFDAIEARLTSLEERVTSLEERMTSLEERMSRNEVLLEQYADDLRAVAEGVTTNGRRIDRVQVTLTERIDGLDRRLESLAASLWPRIEDHEGRITTLEQARRN